MNKKILAAVVCAATVLSLAGCGEKNTSSGNGGGTSNGGTSNGGASNGGTSAPANESVANPDELTDEDDTLSILAWSSNEDVQLLIDFYCKETGTDKSKINWVKVGNKGEESREQYQNYIKGDNDADLIFCDADWAVLYAEMDVTVPLSTIGITKDQYPDAYAYTLAVGTNSKGEFTGATWQATPGCFVYNAKKAEELLGVKSPAEMQEKVKDWDTFKATGKEVYEKSGGKTVLQCTEGGLWQVRQAALSKPWVVDGKFSMDSVADSFYDMAKEYTDEHILNPNNDQWSTAWYNSINDGSAIGDFVPTWGLKGASGSIIYNFAAGGTEDSDGNFVANSSAANDLLAACEGPQGWFWGGTYMMPTSKINTKKTAADFIKFFTQNADAMKKYATENGDFMNNSKAMTGVAFNNPVLIGGQNQFEILLEKAKEIDLDGKVSQYDSQIKSSFNDSVQKYIKNTAGYGSKDEAIVACKKDIAEKISAITVE